MRKRLLLELIYRKAARHEDLRIKEQRLCRTHAIATVRIAFFTLLKDVRRCTAVYMDISALRNRISK